MIASVAVLRRFPRTKGMFDYDVPEDLAVQAGSFVRVPFGKQWRDGVVFSLSTTTTVAKLKPIEGVYDDAPLSLSDLAFYHALSRRTYQSLANVLFASFPERPLRKGRIRPPTIESTDIRIRTSMVADVRRAVTALRHASFLQIAVPSDAFAEAVVLMALRDQKRPTRILCPNDATLLRMHGALLGRHRVTILHGHQSKSEQWTSFREARDGSHDVLLCTRMGALVPSPPHVVTFVLQSGSRDYAQDEQNPHYDARWCLKDVHERTGAPTYFLDVLPRPEDGPIELDLWRPPEHLSLLDIAHTKMSRGLSETLISSLRHTNPSSLFLVYHNRLGTARLLLCRSCEYRWLCDACHRPFRVDDQSLSCASCHARVPLPLSCPSCQGTDLTTKGIGIKNLESRFRQLFSDRVISTVQAGDAFPKQGIAIVTDALWSHAVLPPVSGIAIPSLEHMFAHTGFDAEERAYRTIRRLLGLAFNHDVPCILQAWDAALLSSALRPTRTMYQEEIALRKQLGYPPFQSLVTIRNTKTGSVETRRLAHDAFDTTLASLPPSFDISVR